MNYNLYEGEKENAGVTGGPHVGPGGRPGPGLPLPPLATLSFPDVWWVVMSRE